MKELLKEFLANILGEAPVKPKTPNKPAEKELTGIAKQAASLNVVHKGYGNYGPEGDDKPATYTTQGDGTDAKLVPIAASEPANKPKSTGVKPSPLTAPAAANKQPTPKAPKKSKVSVSQTTRELTGLSKEFRQGVYSGELQSIGTVGSTQGEMSSCSSALDFQLGSTITVDGQILPIPAGVTTKQIEQSKTAINRKKAPTEFDVTSKAIESAWMAQERNRYIKAGGTPPADDWLSYSFRAGMSSMAALRSPEYECDTKATSRGLQDGSIPEPLVMSADNKQKTIDYINGLISTEGKSNPIAAQHYRTLLLGLHGAEDTDTVVYYKNQAGFADMLLVSNKKSRNDPHGNSTPIQRIKRVASRLRKLTPEAALVVTKTLQEAQNIIVQGGDSVTISANHIRSLDSNQITELVSQIRPMLKKLPAEKGKVKDYTDDIAKATPVKKAIQQLYCAENPDKCTGHKPPSGKIKIPERFVKANLAAGLVKAVVDNTEDPPPALLTKFLGKIGDAAGEDSRELMGPIIDAGKQTRQAAKDAHDLVVSRILELDANICADNPSTCEDETGTINGPVTQEYIGAFMEQTHWDQYICPPESDCAEQNAIDARKLVDISGHKVSPTRFRECLADLSGFTGGTKDNSDQKKLWQHLQRKLTINADDDHIAIRDGENIRTIGKETYRTKGTSASLLTFLGKDMINCVMS